MASTRAHLAVAPTVKDPYADMQQVNMRKLCKARGLLTYGDNAKLRKNPRSGDAILRARLMEADSLSHGRGSGIVNPRSNTTRAVCPGHRLTLVEAYVAYSFESLQQMCRDRGVPHEIPESGVRKLESSSFGVAAGIGGRPPRLIVCLRNVVVHYGVAQNPNNLILPSPEAKGFLANFPNDDEYHQYKKVNMVVETSPIWEGFWEPENDNIEESKEYLEYLDRYRSIYGNTEDALSPNRFASHNTTIKIWRHKHKIFEHARALMSERGSEYKALLENAYSGYVEGCRATKKVDKGVLSIDEYQEVLWGQPLPEPANIFEGS